jgi:hypothetical protein
MSDQRGKVLRFRTGRGGAALVCGASLCGDKAQDLRA